jgi:NAD(P)H-flavin reductase
MFMATSVGRERDGLIPRIFRVESYREESSDVFTLELAESGGLKPFYFQPGQFNMVYAFGAGEVALSLSGNSQRTASCFHTVRAVGAITRLLSGLRVGQEVGVRGPFGSAWPLHLARGRDLVIIAGGIGLAPLRPVIHEVLARRSQYQRFCVLYGARSPDALIYRDELVRWHHSPEMSFEVTVDAAPPGWSGNVGVVPQLLERLDVNWSEAVVLMCGPEIMMRFTIGELLRRKVDKNRIHLSMERNMKCGTGFCGHCQYGPKFLCKDGPIFCFGEIQSLFFLREL